MAKTETPSEARKTVVALSGLLVKNEIPQNVTTWFNEIVKQKLGIEVDIPLETVQEAFGSALSTYLDENIEEVLERQNKKGSRVDFVNFSS